jgi:hypothetical protein
LGTLAGSRNNTWIWEPELSCPRPTQDSENLAVNPI